jgi:YVTN family beta-propeller protein
MNRGYIYEYPCKGIDTDNVTYNTYPVISLYASNQVLVNGTPVNVGANPTAVTTYEYATDSSGTVPCGGYKDDSRNGDMRAIVANSGSNSVSILNVVSPSVLYTVPVGRQPVALVANASGSTAYVANYVDGTVTPVNLNSGTAGSPVAVGGNPTSVALTSARVLWVGGVGFLTEINTANMSVVGTQPVYGKTIVALGFSDLENELVASSTDTGGKFYVDEVSPSSFQPGAAYAPLASHAVSTPIRRYRQVRE